jgi:hypothetical protein
VVDEGPIICAFTVPELERLLAWGNLKAGVVDFEPEDDELLERIKRLVAAARRRKPLRPV